MLTWDPATHWFQVPACEKVRKSPWVYNRGTSSFLVPGFALEEYGFRPEGAVCLHPPQVRKWQPLDLAGLPVALWDFQATDVLRFLQGAWGEWAQVGLGKTMIALSAYTTLRQHGLVDGMIVVGPESASHAWVGKSSDTAVHFKESGFMVRAGKQKWPTAGVIFCNYDKIYRPAYAGELLRLVRSGRWVVCCDEAHLLTNYSAKRFQAIDLWSRFAPYRWLLTGTPVSNYPDKLHALWRLLTRNDCTRDQWVGWFQRHDGEWHKTRLASLGRYLTRVSQVRTRKEVAPHLPPTTIRIINVPLEGVQRTAYDGMIRRQKAQLGDEQVRGFDWMGTMVHLLSLCSHQELPFKPERLTQPCAKLNALEEILEGVGESKVCVWSWHPSVLEWLARTLPYKSVQYHGGASGEDRKRAIHEFNHGDAQIFYGNPACCGSGLNLPAGDVRIYWDINWSPVELDQSRGRIERGLSYTPKIEYQLRAENTIEEVIYEALDNKKNLAELILHGKRSTTETWGAGIIRRWK